MCGWVGGARAEGGGDLCGCADGRGARAEGGGDRGRAEEHPRGDGGGDRAHLSNIYHDHGVKTQNTNAGVFCTCRYPALSILGGYPEYPDALRGGSLHRGHNIYIAIAIVGGSGVSRVTGTGKHPRREVNRVQTPRARAHSSITHRGTMFGFQIKPLSRRRALPSRPVPPPLPSPDPCVPNGGIPGGTR